jgi:hypothetical protein
LKVNLNWNKIRNNPVTVQFLLWAILLVADSILNVFVNHGAWWGLCVIITGLVAFFLPRESKIIFGILLMILPIGGILEKRKELSLNQYEAEKTRLESQKEVYNASTYKTSNTNLNCEFDGKYATHAKQKCQAALLALDAKNSKTLNDAKIEKERIRIKNENIDTKIDQLPRSISLVQFFSDPDIFRGLLASIFLPLIQISMSIFTRKENGTISKLEPAPEPGTTEKQMSNAAINSLIELKLKEHKNKVAKVIYDLKTEYELDVYRGRIYEVKRRIQKVSDFEIGQNRTKSDSDQTLIGQEPDKVPTNAGQNLKETFVPWKVENGKS